MQAKFLWINDAREQYWLQILQQALDSLGILETGTTDTILAGGCMERYDSVIIDATVVEDLPDILLRIQKWQPDTKIVVVTVSPTWTRARTAFQAGASDYIRKSTNPDELRTIFERILRRPADISLKEQLSMAKATILFADNDAAFLKTRKEFIENEGYQVLTAATPSEARKLLETARIDLAILDIRLEDDNDEKDLSGLQLAQEAAHWVPKIILTGFPSYEYVREALSPSLSDLPAAVGFIAKQEGAAALMKAVRKALLQRDIFIVHGHDEAAKEATARFVEKLGLRAIVLREQPAASRTIIEKFENYSNVGFAIVLLTPDDVGAARAAATNLRPRARQNVIFELGYFIGKLGRSRVCALYKEDVEIPSDYHGVVYLSMDAGESWKLALAREIKTAGIEIDLNKAI